MVTIWPSFISCLMTSEAFTDILCARSATVMVSGTCTSRTIGSVGAAKPCVAVARSSRGRWRPRRRRAAPAGGGAPPRRSSPRSLDASRRLARASSCADAVRLGGLASAGLSLRLLAAAWRDRAGAACLRRLAARRSAVGGGASLGGRGLASTPRPASLRLRASASARASRRAASSALALPGFASCGFARCARCFGCASSLPRRACARRLACAPRLALRALRRRVPRRRCAGGGGRRRLGGDRRGGRPRPSSRLTKTRFLRTSTWIVRALPLASACLISLVCLRVSVIFLRSAAGGAVRLAQVVEQARLVLLGQRVVGRLLARRRPLRAARAAPPAGIFSSVANWATVVCAMCSRASLRCCRVAARPARSVR